MAAVDNPTALPLGPVHMDQREREERREAGWAVGKEARGGSGSNFTMEERKRPTSEIYLPSINLGSVVAETLDNHELPIISLSKSSTEMVHESAQRMEVPWCRQHSQKRASNTACTVRPASLGGPTTVPLTLCDYEQGSMCSRNNTTETVIWHGGTARPWGITDGSPRRTPSQDLLQNLRMPCSPSTNRVKGLRSREGCCGPAENLTGCSCCRMTCRMDSSSISNSFSQQVANTLGHAQSNCERQHLTPCPICTCAGQVMNAGCVRNACNVVSCPGHLISRSACTGSPCPAQRSLLHSGLLAFPPLVSSISETRLDSRSSGHCCRSELRGQNSSSLRIDRTDLQTRLNRAVKDATTMTSNHELKDIGVQTLSCVNSVSHVFPEISLRTDPNSETCFERSDTCPRTPVKEVEWDAEGMTWEVYGASVDPEELGLAIQRHLELQIKETAAAAAAEREDSTDTVSSLAFQQRQRKKSEGIINALRSSACCSNPNTVGD